MYPERNIKNQQTNNKSNVIDVKDEKVEDILTRKQLIPRLNAGDEV